MNDRERLLAEALAGHDGGPFARIAAARARRRQTLRQATVAGTSALALVGGFLLFRAPSPSAHLPAMGDVSSGPVIEILSDEDLLRALGNQPMLVLRDASGITGVVFLEPAPSTKL